MLLDADKKKNAEIDRICARNYEGFIESVEEILQMRGSASKVTQLVYDVHNDVESNGEDLIRVLKELEKIQKERNETKKALDAAHHCKQVVALVVQAKQQIQTDDHYGALKTIERIQSEQPNITSRTFATSLAAWLAELINNLVGAAQTEVDAWQIQLRKKCSLVGSTILRNYVNTRSEYKAMLALKSTLSTLSIQKCAKILRCEFWMPPNEFQRFIPTDLHAASTQEGLKLIDGLSDQFSSLHKAYYINSIIGDVRAFRIRVNDSRTRTIKGFLDVAKNSCHEKSLMVALPELLVNLCGFFISECVARQVVEYNEESNSWSELHQLWEQTGVNVATLVSLEGNSLKELAQIHKCKETLLLVADTMSDEVFSLRAEPVLNVMSVLQHRLKQLIQESIRTLTLQTLLAASNQPLHVNSSEVYEAQIRAFRLNTLDDAGSVVHANQAATATAASKSVGDRLDALEADLDSTVVKVKRAKSFTGQTFAFSQTVPSITRGLYDVTLQLFLFCYRNDQLAQRGELIIHVLLDACLLVAKEMQKDLMVDGASTPLAKSCQMSIDASSLAQACQLLFKRVVAHALAHFQWTDSIDIHMNNACKRTLKEFTALANLGLDMVFENLNVKVEELLGSLVYENWEPQTYPTGCHEAVDSIVDFLQITFMWLTHLPQAAREAAHFTTCARITSFTVEYILSNKVPRLNYLAIVALQADVVRLIAFAEGTGVPQLKQCFAELEDLSNALLDQDLPQFGEDIKLMQSRFPQLDPLKLAKILEKVSCASLSICRVRCVIRCCS